jgi:dTDP-4-amino-4,6-dideoxygalactose transaminase
VLPPLPPGAYRRAAAKVLPFPLDQPSVACFGYARSALGHGIRALGVEPGAEALLPAYHCGAEVEALARAGVKCSFYDVTERLEPDPDQLGSLVGERTRILYLIHYFGFSQDVEFWRSWCDERGLLMFEDAAHAWLCSHRGRPVGSVGDLSVFCFHKAVGIPDGAALHVPGRRLGEPPASVAGGLARTMRNHVKWGGGRVPAPARLAAGFKPGGEDWEGEWRDSNGAPTRMSRYLLPRLYDRSIAERRRAHYGMLLERLAGMVPAAFANLPEGTSPYAFPVRSHAKAELRAALERAGIFPRDWLTPHHSLPVADYPGAAAARSRLLALPVHQELRRRDVIRVAEVAASQRHSGPPL